MSNQESVQSTIEDKLRDTLNLLLPIYAESYILENTRVRKQAETNRMIAQIQAIITTETTKARIDELNRLPRHSKDRWPTSPEFDNVQLAVHVPARLAALQKEQKR